MQLPGAKGLGLVVWREEPGPARITTNKMADHPPMSFDFKKCLKYASEVKILPKINMRASKVIRW